MCNYLRLAMLLVSVWTTAAVSPTTLDLVATATGVSLGANLCPVLDAGINITCLMDHGDETGRSYCEGDSSTLVCTSHAYTAAGYYTMWSHCLSEDIHLNDSATIYVGNKIVNMQALVDGQMFAPLATTASATMTITYDNGTDLFLNITNAVTGDPIYSGNSTGLSETRVFTPAHFGGVLGQHAVEITLSNPLHAVTRYVVFDVEQTILTPVMTTNVMSHMHVDDVATFKETMSFGSNIIGALEFPNIAYADRRFGEVREMCMNWTWTTTGTFTFEVIFSNMVDSVTYPYVVVVQYPVNNISATGINIIFVSNTLDIAFTMTADALFPMGVLNASISYGDGTSNLLDLSSFTQGSSVPDSHKTYAPGTYFVEISVYSETSHMNFSWTQYVEHPIQGLELVHVLEAPMSESVQNVSLRMTDPSVSPLLNITCVFDIDGKEYVEMIDMVYGVNFTIIHPFVGDGNKTITFNCSNRLSNEVGESFMDLYTDCFLSGQLFSPIYKSENTPVQMYVTDINMLTAKAYVTEMCRNSTRFYWWTLWKVNNDDVNDLTLQTYFEKPYNQPNAVTITFSKMSMAPGLYKVQFLFNLTDIEGGYIIDHVYANFMLPPFIAGIAGGSTRNIGNDAVIQINSKDASYDPLTYMQWVPFTYNWVCRKSASTKVAMSELIAQFQSQNVTVDVSTLGTDCTDPSWPTNGVIPFDASAVADSFWYLFTVRLSKSGDSRTGEAIQGIYVMPSTPPTILINCLRNCLPKIAQDTKLILEGLCPECELDQTTYVWVIEIYNTATDLYEPYPNLTAILDTGLDGDTLAIQPDSLVFGDVLRFTNTVTKAGNPISATASYVASVNHPPYGGTCTIDPVEGEAAVTLFTIECLGMLDEGTRLLRGTPDADRNEALKYNVYQKRVTPSSTEPVFSVIGMSSESIIKAVLNVGDPANNFTTDVIVRITDVFHGYTEFVLPVTVTQPLVINDTWTTEDIQEATQSFVLSNLVEARLSNDANIIMQYAESISSVLSQMMSSHQFENDTTLSSFELGEQPLQWSVGMIDVNEFGNDTIPYQTLLDNLLEIPVDRVQNAVVAAMDNLTNEMIAALGQANVTTYFTIMTAATAFSNALSDPLITSSASAINAADALATLTNGYTNLTENKLSDFFGKSDPNIEAAADNLFELVNSLISVTVPPELPDTYEALAVQTTADARLYVEFMARVNRDEAYILAEASDLTPEERVGLFKMRSRIEQMKFKQKQELAEITMRQAVASADAISDMLQNSVCKGCRDDYTYDNFHVTLINDYLINVDLKIGDVDDSNVTLDGIGDPYLVIKFTTTKFTKNPFIFGDTVSAAAITSDVHRLKLTDVDDKDVPIALVMVIQPVPGLISGSFMPFYTPDDASRCFYHEFIYRKLGDYVCVFIDQEDPEKVRQYDVFIRQGEYPTHLTYDQTTFLIADRDWMSCISPHHFTKIGITYVGLRPIPIPGMGPYEWTPLNGPYIGSSYNISDPSLNPYNLTITTAGCMTWDSTKESWGGNKCVMDWYPPKYEVECTCNTAKDLTFGNTFYVPPNTIDFSTAFLKFSPQDQAAVLALLILIILSYIVLMIWARHQDKKDIVKWGVTPLMDNNIDDTYYYMVTVYTGMRRDAGTESRIGFVVSGSDGDTGIRELYDGVRRKMGTATVNHFLMTTPHPLGEIDYIYIWHDNSGEGSMSSWYLNRMDIEDIQEKQKYFFLCGKWLSMDNPDDNIDAVLPVCGKENVTTFENMFYMNTKENLAENHIWISIFFRPTSSHFTRCQRVTCLMVFLMMSMISNAIYFTPNDEFENPSLVRVGPLKFSLQSVYVSVISALISTPAVFLIVLMFRKSKPRTINQNLHDPSLKYAIPAVDSIAEKMLTESKELEKTLVAKGIIKADGTILPFWCAYIAWFLSLVGTTVVMFFLMLYSMEWGKQKSEMWLTQFVLSFFEASAILDPIKVIMMAAFFAFIFTQLDKFKPSPLDRGLILRNYRQRFSCPTDITMPARFFTPETIQEARKERQRDMMMARAVKECFLTIVFLWILYSISFSNRDDRSYRVHDIISKHFVYPQDKRPTFPSIQTTVNFIDWLKLTAFPSLFPEYEYNGEKMHWRWRQYYADLTNFRVGPPRLRQVRVIEDDSDYPFFGKIKTYPEYSFTNEESKDFCFHWKPLPCNVEKEAYSFSYNGWKHTSASSIWGIPVTGYYTTYSGGGYITELDVNWDFSNRTLEELNRLFWFDRQTRAVFLEFTLYSANLNLFTYVMLMAEFPETGGVTTMYTIYPMRIYQHHGSTGVYMIFCEVMFLVFLLLMALKVIYGMVKTRGNFFGNAWNVVDFFCVVGGFIGVAMYFGRLILANETLNKFKEDPKNFVNFQHLAFWDLIFVTVLSCLVFLSTLRVVGVLGYDKRIGEVFRVVDNCARDLFWFGVLFFYIFMGYCMLGFLIFGRNIKAYWNIFDTMGTLFISMIGKSKFTELNEQDPLLAQLYFFTYILMIVYVLLTMFLAILCDSIAMVHAQTKNDRSEELVAFIIEQLKKLFSSSKKKKEKAKLNIAADGGPGKQKPIDLLSDLRLNLHDIVKHLPQKERNPFMK